MICERLTGIDTGLDRRDLNRVQKSTQAGQLPDSESQTFETSPLYQSAPFGSHLITFEEP